MTTLDRRPIPDLDPYYADTKGRIWRRLKNGRWQLRAVGRKDGYASLLIGGRRYMVSRIVLLAFTGPPPTPYHEAAHEDGNRRNNRPDNLRWATHAENCKDKERHGTHQAGMNAANRKLRAADVRTIRGSPATNATLARIFKVDPSTISLIRRGFLWSSLSD